MYDIVSPKLIHNRKVKQRQAKLKAKKLCTVCGVNPLVNSWRCVECEYKKTIRQRERRRIKRMIKMMKRGKEK